MKKVLIVGNWKMHLNAHEASVLVHRLEERIHIHRDVEVVLAPTALVMQPLSVQIDRRKFRLAAQNAHQEDHGAFTGEVSFNMLRDLAHYAIIGHSERRYKFGERDRDIAQKVRAALRNNIEPILCVGDTASDRADKATKQVLHDQVMADLTHITSSELKRLTIAYEPVWAISDGTNFKKHKTPAPGEVEEAVGTIRHNLEHLFGKTAAGKVRILYGGSVHAENARSYLDVNGVDGLLVGGASLNYHQFADIVETAYRYATR